MRRFSSHLWVVTSSASFSSEVTPDCSFLPQPRGLLPTEVATRGMMLCHSSHPGMGTPPAGVADRYFILQRAFMCLSSGKKNVPNL